MSTAEDLAKWATMFQLLFEAHGFRLWWVHPNAARAPGAKMHEAIHRLPYSRGVWEPGPPPMAWEIALRRFDDGGRPVGATAAPPLCPKGARSAHPRPGKAG